MSTQHIPDDAITVNLVRLAGLDKHKARECERIVRAVLAAQQAPVQPAVPPVASRELSDADMDQVVTWIAELDNGGIGFHAFCDRIICLAAAAPGTAVLEAQGEPTTELERWGRAKPMSAFLLDRTADGYWTPWHIADKALRQARAQPAPAAQPEQLSQQGKAQPPAAPDVIAFLMGEAPLDGVWFGDKHPTEKGAFWWRKHLRAIASSPAEVRRRAIAARKEE
jgi:hypothetical protein